MKTKYKKEDLEIIVSDSISIHQVLMKLGLNPTGGNYKHIPNVIKYYKINIDHFKKQGWNKGLKIGPKRDIKEYLVNPCKYHLGTHALKIRLIKEGIFEHKCYKCNLNKWLNEIIPLELEHIDGNNENNLIENLTLLCPNCHAKTSTYRGKNKKNKTTKP